ncbi:zinc finger protein 462-like isoform X2 [Anguilla anguilla]|uniref:zinc finger protein 462-like isoform X2 n=1 Tax=Anguilla anguilla TaxID=7936 RepID=UPI0015ADB125|nr:zinc finger protein 462-like isoform X2 [Anguilla anguilla]
MEVLQCDGCDFRAESCDDLKTHIQDVHTSVLLGVHTSVLLGVHTSVLQGVHTSVLQGVHTDFQQPTVGGEQAHPWSSSTSLNSLSQAEEEEDPAARNEDESPNELTGIHSFDMDSGDVSSSNQMISNQSMKQSSKSASQFFQCKFCIRYFRSKPLLYEHTRKVHGIIEGALLSERKSLPPQASEECSYSILMQDGFEKVFSCQYCTYKSPRRARILKHQKIYHKSNLLESPGSPSESSIVSSSVIHPSQEPYCDLPEEVRQRSILESMVKPLTKSRGNFSCEWCSYQTVRRERWCDHMMKKHRSMVKIISSFKQLQDEGGEEASSKRDSPSSPRSLPSSNLILKNSSSTEYSSSYTSGYTESAGSTIFRYTSEPVHKSQPYSQVKSNMSNSTESSVLSERGDFEKADSGMDLEINDSRSSSDDELKVLNVNSTSSLLAEGSTKQQLSEEDNKMLEKEGIPFRKYMNRFQCPFCSFLTTHRQSISRHIENIHLSGKTTVYKCDECHFLCTSQLRLAAHKKCHMETSSEWEPGDIQNENPAGQSEEPMNGVNGSGKVIDKKSRTSAELSEQNPYCCTLCSFSTTSLKGLRDHQQQKHTCCQEVKVTAVEESSTEQHDSELETYSPSNYLQKTQMSILGFSSKKAVKTARKSINDVPLDLSPLKKRTRIDEIATNLQTKISQSKQQVDTMINLEDIDDVEEVNGSCVEMGEAGQDEWQLRKPSGFHRQRVHLRELEDPEEGIIGKEKHTPQQKFSPSNVPIQPTSDSEENVDEYCVSAESKGLQDQTDQDSQDDFQEGPGTLFYCKHCEYHNKSARSVSTHYQRMHPYIKFSFRYILDPEDQSAVFRCLECYVEYTTFDDLNQHYGEHHPEAINVLNLNQPDLVYKCRFCLYTSPNVRSLMPHYQRMHPTVKINNAMIFSSYIVEQPEKELSESQTLREILNSGPNNFAYSTSTPRSSAQSSPVHSKTPESCQEHAVLKESMFNNVVVYDCDICSFSSPNMHSVLVHYQKSHPQQKASYIRIQKSMREVDKCQTSGTTTCDSNTHSAPKISNASPLGIGDEMYHCKHCVYSNRSVVGVLVHYQKRHPEVKVTAKYIKHAPPTPGVLKLMEDLQLVLPKQFLKPFNNKVIDSSSSSVSRSGGGKEEVEMLFFCQHCDYGNRTVKGVLIHCQKKHRDVKANADLVRRHTAVVRSQREKAPLTRSGSASITSCAPDLEKMRPLRSLRCRLCPYTSPYVYALRKHLKKDHPTLKAAAITILQWAYQDGVLQAGYHCEWCIYSHSEPNGLLMHYQRRHPEHNVDYAYMAAKLWAGPDSPASPPQGSSDTKRYQCRNCDFEASSVWDITNHYHAVHPWAIKADESILLDIIKGSQSSGTTQTQVSEVHVALSNQFDSYACKHSAETLDVGPPPETVTRLSFASTSISYNPFKCNVCYSEYNSLHGLLTHYGKKHPGMKVKAVDFAQETDPGSVYKCRHCPYANSRIHGVLTHYQKKHPLIKVTAEDFADDIEQMINNNEAEEKGKTQRQGYGAYRCKICPYTHGTLEKLKIHYEKYHNHPEWEEFKSSSMQFSDSKEERLPECSSMSVEEVNDFQSALAQFPIIKGEKHAVFRCQLCKYFCSTRKGIARHYRIKHNSARAQPEGTNSVFKCALCSYTNTLRKGLAAHYQKRHDIDAYYTHCLAASKALCEKPSEAIAPETSRGEGPSLSEEIRLPVERRKCSLCSFQTFSQKSIISHYNKHHPGVFPKRQHPSKLGCYFTMVYTKEPEHLTDAEKNKQIEECPEKEKVNVAEWLPFKCVKCFKLSFNTAELLCMHYNDYHSKHFKRDFTTFPSPAQDHMDCYKCAQCDTDLMDLLELSAHLTNHNEEFWKQANQQERREQEEGTEQLESNTEKLGNHTNEGSVGYRCNFCMEVHSTLRAICSHLRTHVPDGEIQAGRVKEVAEGPVSGPAEVVNGDLPEVETLASGLRSLLSQAAVPRGRVDVQRGRVDVQRGRVDGGVMKPAGGHPCSQCDRVLVSKQGLRSHERSHSSTLSPQGRHSCLFCHFSSPFRHTLDRHVQAQHGLHKPFQCQLCSFQSASLSPLRNHLQKAHAGGNTYRCLSCPFSTLTISQLKSHSLEAHQEELTLPDLRAASQTAPLSQSVTLDCEKSLTVLESEESEPPDVQRQLDHYQLGACTGASISPPTPSRPPTPRSPPAPSSLPAPPEAEPRPGGVLSCQLCDFRSGYIQSLRRHYRDRHGGRKLFKCKDCPFFTCYRPAFSLHVGAGHPSVPEENPKDLRCPLCLYHTKYKGSMIDHIVLHREERVVPLEVRRSKLSRHLQGVVFRCHRCTFTCSRDDTLQLHARKHHELKPYKCELCFYDSKRCQDLETHLSSEHKVMRNFELVGRVNLDQLEASKGQPVSLSSAEDEEEEEDHEEAKKEKQEEELSEQKEPPGSPCSRASACSEKPFRCEFCGRVFARGTEWERHVLRHGMTAAAREVERERVADAPARSGVSLVAVPAEGDFLGSTVKPESQDTPGRAKIEPLDKDEEMTKNYTSDMAEHCRKTNNSL